MAKQCTHVSEVKPVAPRTQGCEECLQSGDRWLHLRMCMSCGHIGCCDSSKNKHATRHFKATGHPIIKPFGSEADWAWCCIDQTYVQL